MRLEVLEGRDLPAALLPLLDNVEGNLIDYYRLLQPVGEAAGASPAAEGMWSVETSLTPEDRLGLVKRFHEAILHNEAGYPVVQVWTRDQTRPVLDDLAGLGLTPTEVRTDYRLIELGLDLDLLPAVAELPGVLAITPAFRPLTRAGSVQTQGDAVMRADLVRAADFDGAAVKVGVISDSALNLSRSRSTGDLPTGIDRYLELAASDEGRAMMEIVHDIAPGAALAHYSGFYSAASFAAGIRALAAIGSQVIVDDLGYFDQPFFQDGIVAQAVNDVTAGGVVYVSAAGNDADLAYESAFIDADPAGSTHLHDFDAAAGVDTRQRITTPTGTYNVLILQWDDPFYTTAGVSHDVYLRFVHYGYYTGYGLALDNLRVRTAASLNDAPTLTCVSTLTRATEDTGYTITHAALLDF